jgi:serine phosphatase RsbU (regulator of sigma subunit)
LGAYPVEVVEQLVDLEKGDSIIFYTDGVIEARSDGETFGAERLREIVAGCVGKTASKPRRSRRRFSGLPEVRLAMTSP